MEAQFSHEKLEVYQVYLDFVRMSGEVVPHDDISMAALKHLDRATESIGVNLVRANTHAAGSKQRGYYLDISIGSTCECAACLDVCCVRELVEKNDGRNGKDLLWRIRGMLLGLKNADAHRTKEPLSQYDGTPFPHANLKMYDAAMEAVQWVHPFLVDPRMSSSERQKLDKSTTGTVLNIAEGYGRATPPDKKRFFKTAYEHALQTVMLLDLAGVRGSMPCPCVEEGKQIQHSVVSMLHSWCDKMGR